MILTDELIEKADENGFVKIEPFIEKQIQSASYDLRIGPEAAVASKRGRVNIEADGVFKMKPGDFAMVATEEIITLNNQHTGRFGLCRKWARKGLVAATDTLIAPGFSGRLVIGLTNLSSQSIVLSHRDDFLTVEFHQLKKPVKKPYSGKHQNQSALSTDDLQAVLDREVLSVPAMDKTLERLLQQIPLLEKSQDLRWKSVALTIAVAVLIMTSLGLFLQVLPAFWSFLLNLFGIN